MELDLTRIFVKVAQNGSFSRAAEILRMPKSTVSKSVSRLERETGTKLILRTTRSLTLTPAGRIFYDASLGPVTQLEDAQKSLYGQDSILTGTVRITAPEDLGGYVIAPAIAELSARNPDLRFELKYTDVIIDLVKDGFDLAVRLGKISDSTLKMKRASDVSLIAVTAPKYLKKAEKLKSPMDLVNHACISIGAQGYDTKWTMKSSRGTVHVPIISKITSNQMTSLMRSAVAGAGVALVPSFICTDYLHAGDLVRVLPEWSTPGIPVSIMTPLAPSSSARLKVTVDHIHAAITKALGN